jgi:signal transduction histidine kinase
VAIANADLYTRAQRLAVIEERTRIARELHDAATQALFGLVLEARAAALSTDDDDAREKLAGFERRAAAALQELRGLVHALRPSSLERDGLAAALLDHVDALRRAGADITVEVESSAGLTLEQEHALLRIAQEALHNAMRHAPGARVQVTLRPDAGSLLLRVRDRGPGFDERSATAGMGLSGLRERAAQIGATLELSVDGGTAVSVRLPLRGRPRG